MIHSSLRRLTGLIAMFPALILLPRAYAVETPIARSNGHMLFDIQLDDKQVIILTLFDMQPEYKPDIAAFDAANPQNQISIERSDPVQAGTAMVYAVVLRKGVPSPQKLTLLVRYLDNGRYFPVKSCTYTIRDRADRNNPLKLDASLTTPPKAWLNPITIAPRDPIVKGTASISIHYPIEDATADIRLSAVTATGGALQWERKNIRSWRNSGIDSEDWFLEDTKQKLLPPGTYLVRFEDMSTKVCSSLMIIIE